jgi:hypothetical protein
MVVQGGGGSLVWMQGKGPMRIMKKAHRDSESAVRAGQEVIVETTAASSSSSGRLVLQGTKASAAKVAVGLWIAIAAHSRARGADMQAKGISKNGSRSSSTGRILVLRRRPIPTSSSNSSSSNHLLHQAEGMAWSGAAAQGQIAHLDQGYSQE